VYGAGRAWRVKYCPCCGSIGNRDVSACLNMLNIVLYFTWSVGQRLVAVVGERPQPFERAHDNGVAAVQHASRGRQAALSQARPEPPQVPPGMRRWQRALLDWSGALARLHSSLLWLQRVLGYSAPLPGQHAAAYLAPLAGQHAAAYLAPPPAQQAAQAVEAAQRDVMTAWERACQHVPSEGCAHLRAMTALQLARGKWLSPGVLPLLTVFGQAQQWVQWSTAQLRALQTQQRALQSTEARRQAQQAQQQARQRRQQQADAAWAASQPGMAMQVRAAARSLDQHAVPAAAARSGGGILWGCASSTSLPQGRC
jgi:hypothetical protein